MRSIKIFAILGLAACSFTVRGGVGVSSEEPGTQAPRGGGPSPAEDPPTHDPPPKVDDPTEIPETSPVPPRAPFYGDPCDDRADNCGGGLSCIEWLGGGGWGGGGWGGSGGLRFTDGYCTNRCGNDRPACPGGTTCVRLVEDDAAVCLAACGSGCRTGYRCCTNRVASGVCTPSETCDS